MLRGNTQGMLMIQKMKQRMLRPLKQRKITDNRLRRLTMKSLKMMKKKRKKKQNQKQLKGKSHRSQRSMKSKHSQLKVFKSVTLLHCYHSHSTFISICLIGSFDTIAYTQLYSQWRKKTSCCKVFIKKSVKALH